MIKTIGELKTTHILSCFACQKPYPTLSEAAKNRGSSILPTPTAPLSPSGATRYVNGINLLGWHFHCLSGDKTHGVHILWLSADHQPLKVNHIERFDLTLPCNPKFAQRDLREDPSAKTTAVEGMKK